VVAVLDASVLYPAPLRDLLMNLALTDLFQARWTDQIHGEWTRNVLEDRSDLTIAQISRTRALMDAHVPQSLVTDFEHLIADLQLPDPDDRHVLASAIHVQANVIVTANLKHFPTRALEPYAIQALHPDVFCLKLWDVDQTAVLAALRAQRANLRKPSMTAAALLEVLHQQGLTRFVRELQDFATLI
jgi:predicted nucleic acid-binding protein